MMVGGSNGWAMVRTLIHLRFELLGLDRDERDALVTAVETSVEVEEATTPGDRVEAILQVLEDACIDDLGDLNPTSRSPISGAEGIQNTGVVMVTTGNVASIRRLVEDLEELVNTPDLMAECQRRSKISPVGRRKTSPFYVMPKALLRVVPVVHRRDPRGFA